MNEPESMHEGMHALTQMVDFVGGPLNTLRRSVESPLKEWFTHFEAEDVGPGVRRLAFIRHYYQLEKPSRPWRGDQAHRYVFQYSEGPAR